jgi:hypothetical protein
MLLAIKNRGAVCIGIFRAWEKAYWPKSYESWLLFPGLKFAKSIFFISLNKAKIIHSIHALPRHRHFCGFFIG